MNTNRKARGWWMLLLVAALGLSGIGGGQYFSASSVANAETIRFLPATGSGEIRRKPVVRTVAIHATIGSADAIDIGAVADLAIEIPTGVTSITFWGCDTEDGTYRAIYDYEGNAATITTTADRWYGFPPSCFPHCFIKIVSAGANGSAKVVAKT